MKKKQMEILLGICFVILAVLLYKSTASFRTSSIVTTGFYIKFLAISLALSGGYELVKALIKNDTSKVSFAKNPKRFMSLIALLILYVFIMEYLGFIISSMIFLPLCMFAMGYKKVLKSFVISAFVVAFVYGLFVQVFDIPLPESSLLEEFSW